MTAPVLSPAEQAEVDRFGLYDEDVIADLERNQDDTPKCGTCESPATVVCRLRCCGHSFLACDNCLARMRQMLALSRAWFYCENCGHHFGFVSGARDVMTVVPL